MKPTSHELLLFQIHERAGTGDPDYAKTVAWRLWRWMMGVKSNSHGVELIELPNVTGKS